MSLYVTKVLRLFLELSSSSVDTNFPNVLLLYPSLSSDDTQHDTPRQHDHDHLPNHGHHHGSHDEHLIVSDVGNSNVSDLGDSGGGSDGGGGGSD